MNRAPYPFCVLVVDAEVGPATALVRKIKDMGHDAHAAHSHADALRLARSLLPHVILLDVVAPLASHRDLTREYRSVPDLAESYLIALTSYEPETNRPASIAAGFDDHLWKPVGPRLLEALMNYLVLKLRSLEAERPEGGCAD